MTPSERALLAEARTLLLAAASLAEHVPASKRAIADAFGMLTHSLGGGSEPKYPFVADASELMVRDPRFGGDG